MKQDDENEEKVTILVYRDRWKKLKEGKLKRELEGETSFTIADALEEAIGDGLMEETP